MSIDSARPAYLGLHLMGFDPHEPQSPNLDRANSQTLRCWVTLITADKVEAGALMFPLLEEDEAAHAVKGLLHYAKLRCRTLEMRRSGEDGALERAAEAEEAYWKLPLEARWKR